MILPRPSCNSPFREELPFATIYCGETVQKQRFQHPCVSPFILLPGRARGEAEEPHTWKRGGFKDNQTQAEKLSQG
ncbi:hypothetical protein NDU88_008440 [Pleurodeles waltl]|uniref:Uncharacterized protein n=1 Tax=Pleurodeles waltl TaxID=8319 RepID=A0AAV7PT53_PLEWA|nr:hypothetical protein NDU88_008440 [Pleurodeles waltl]